MHLRRPMQCACRPSGFLLGILAVPILLLPDLAPAQPASVPTDSLYARAEARLRGFAEAQRRFAKPGEKEAET